MTTERSITVCSAVGVSFGVADFVPVLPDLSGTVERSVTVSFDVVALSFGLVPFDFDIDVPSVKPLR